MLQVHFFFVGKRKKNVSQKVRKRISSEVARSEVGYREKNSSYENASIQNQIPSPSSSSVPAVAVVIQGGKKKYHI